MVTALLLIILFQVLMVQASPVQEKLASACLGKKNGYYPVPGDCSHFLLCVDEKPHLMSCPDGLLWSPTAKYCDVISRVSCDVKSSEATTSEEDASSGDGPLVAVDLGKTGEDKEEAEEISQGQSKSGAESEEIGEDKLQETHMPEETKGGKEVEKDPEIEKEIVKEVSKDSDAGQEKEEDGSGEAEAMVGFLPVN